jgi:UPF0042 nucleotide-binding protein
MTEPQPSPNIEAIKLVIVTGLSGAGRTAALRCLEDQGYEAMDNFPLTLLPVLLAETDGQSPRPLAIGLDARSREFSSQAVQRVLHVLQDRASTRLVFMEASEAVLLRRFKESRRAHPLAGNQPLIQAMAAERLLLDPLRRESDLLVDTSELKTDELKRLLQSRLPAPNSQPLQLTLLSFAYKRGLPPEADWVFDMRFLRNPFYDPMLRNIDGRDPQIAAYLDADAQLQPFLARVFDLLQTTLPLYQRDNRPYLTVAFGCTGGFHRSVRSAVRMHEMLSQAGVNAGLVHRDVEKGV